MGICGALGQNHFQGYLLLRGPVLSVPTASVSQDRAQEPLLVPMWQILVTVAKGCALPLLTKWWPHGGVRTAKLQGAWASPACGAGAAQAGVGAVGWASLPCICIGTVF